jgi:hypothetical protein
MERLGLEELAEDLQVALIALPTLLMGFRVDLNDLTGEFLKRDVLEFGLCEPDQLVHQACLHAHQSGFCLGFGKESPVAVADTFKREIKRPAVRSSVKSPGSALFPFCHFNLALLI